MTDHLTTHPMRTQPRLLFRSLRDNRRFVTFGPGRIWWNHHMIIMDNLSFLSRSRLTRDYLFDFFVRLPANLSGLSFAFGNGQECGTCHDVFDCSFGGLLLFDHLRHKLLGLWYVDLSILHPVKQDRRSRLDGFGILDITVTDTHKFGSLFARFHI